MHWKVTICETLTRVVEVEAEDAYAHPGSHRLQSGGMIYVL